MLLDHIRKAPGSRLRDHELLALAKALVFSISNLKFGPEVGVRPPKADAPVISAWLDGIRTMVHDLRHIKGGSDYGIDTCWFNPQRLSRSLDVRIRYEIHELSALLDIVGVT